MKKNFIVLGLITLFIAAGGFFFFSKNKEPKVLSLPSSYEYFWGDGCPHCANVQAFFDSWDKKDQVPVEKKEVWNNPENARLMQERAKYCNITPSGMGVPFLFTPDGKCLIGDTPIIDYFKSL